MTDLHFLGLRALLLLLISAMPSVASAQLMLMNDMVLDANALLMPSSATYGRAINGVSFQAEPLLTYGGYQYATWYHNGSDEDVYIGRRALTGDNWEVLDTGSNLDNGDSPSWDAHNVISLGISGDGRMHFSWDLHGHTLRYRDSDTGDATGATWNGSLFNPERSALNPSGTSISTLTYPQFTTDVATGDMFINYRTGGSGAGNQYIATYDATTGIWNTPHEFINGTNSLFYDDNYGQSSSNRNAYLNGLDIDTAGRLHTTWTWRETATGSSNHDIMYAYSDDGGNTWKNNTGTVVGTPGSPMDMNSPGIIIVPMDRGNTLMNQQTQAVDLDNRVHMVMWHKRDDAPPVTGFTTTPAAYFHYYRDPATGTWNRTELPTTRAVGSRPDMAYDEYGNIYVTYLSPGPGDNGGYYTNGDLIVASASKSTGYEDWEIVYTDTRDFAGEPFVDLRRLLDDGIVSVVIQENSPNTGRTGSALHVLEFEKLANKVVWAGDNTGSWAIGTGTDWDNDNNDIGDEAFENGFRVTFDDGATDFSVVIPSSVAPASTTFSNSSEHAYSITGEGIGGNGSLTVNGGGMVTLANAANTYLGDTGIESGTLSLSGNAVLAGSPQIKVHGGAALDVIGLDDGLPLNGQTLTIEGSLQGNIAAMNGSLVQFDSAQPVAGSLTVNSGSTATGSGQITGDLVAEDATVRIGGTGLPSSVQAVTTVIDDFNDGNLSEYVKTVVNDPTNLTANISFSSISGSLSGSYSGTSAVEQLVLMRDDVTLAVDETLMVDVAMPFLLSEMDLGLAVAAIDIPIAASGADTDTRDTFDWASVSVRPTQNAIRVNQSVNGSVNTTTGSIASVSETSVTGLFITRTSDTQFLVGYTNSSSENVVATAVNYSATDVGTAVGFYADLRADGAMLGNFDNLRILGSSLVVQSEILAIEGDVILNTGSVLEFDVYSPGIGDLLAVGGHLSASGTLMIALDPSAQAPSVGDQFQILSFATASGGFDTFELPALQAGLAWNVTDLLNTGMLDVVVDVDLDDDGDVDGRDFLAIQRTDPSLTSAWQHQYGNRVVAPAGSMAIAVPEPNSLALSYLITLFVTTVHRRSIHWLKTRYADALA